MSATTPTNSQGSSLQPSPAPAGARREVVIPFRVLAPSATATATASAAAGVDSLAPARFSPIVSKKEGAGKTDVPADRSSQNQKTDLPPRKPAATGEALFTSVSTAVQGLAESYFHVDHRLRKWPKVFSAPKVVDNRIVGNDEVNKKVAALQKAQPALVQLALSKTKE